MANPNIICAQSVTLSSNAVLLPAEATANSTTYNAWSTSRSRRLLTNPVGSNKVYKVTSMALDHSFKEIAIGGGAVNVCYAATGISIFTTASTVTSAGVTDVKGYHYGGIEQVSMILETTPFTTYGPPNYQGSVSQLNPFGDLQTPQEFVGQLQLRSLVCNSSTPIYLTEGESLWGVSRLVKTNPAFGLTFDTGPGNVAYSYEEISS
jgi:hypothetical protein